MGYAARHTRDQRTDQNPIPAGWRPFVWHYGPIWTAAIGAPRPPGTEARGALAVTCLIDTGSSHTFATCDLLARLALTPTGETISVYAADTVREQQNFRVDLAIPSTLADGDGILLRNWNVSDSAPLFGGPLRPYDLVIGNDALRFCRFAIDGPRSLFRIEKA